MVDLVASGSGVTVLIGDEQVVIEVGENTQAALMAANAAVEQVALAGSFASDASLAASAASAASNYFPSLAEGEFGTTTGQLFSYPDGTGGIIYRERTGGGSIEIAHFMASEVALRSDLENITGAVPGETRKLNEKGRFGWFKFFSAALYAATFGATLTAAVAADTAQGVHVAPSSDTTGAGGAWVREVGGWINAENFGFVAGDFTTGVSGLNDNAWLAMQSYFDAIDRNVSAPFVANGPKVFFPGAQYCYGKKTVLNRSLHIIGNGAGALSETTWFRWTVEADAGLVFNRGGSTYPDEVSANTGAGGSIIEGILFQGPGGTPVGTAAQELLYSAIRAKDRVTIKNCTFRNWRGVGVCISASVADAVSSPFYGNINGCILDNLRIESCRYGGVWVSGGDANVIDISNVDIGECGRFGFWLSPFLGVNLKNCQVAHCGLPTHSGLSEYSLCTDGGIRYYAKYDASTAQLQGTAPASSAYWIYYDTGGATADILAWSGAGNFVPGGSYGGTGDFVTATGCYHETGQGLPQLPAATFIGGFMGSGVSDCPQIYGGVSGFGSNKPFYQNKTYTDGSTVAARLGGTMGDTWVDMVGFQSSVASAGFDPQRFSSFAFEKATGDLGYKYGASAAQYQAGQTPIFRLPGQLTNMTYGGRSQAEARNVVEIKTLALGDGNNARFLNGGSGAPSSGYTAQGDIQFDRAAAAAGKAGHFTTTSGTIGSTAVVKQFAAIDA